MNIYVTGTAAAAAALIVDATTIEYSLLEKLIQNPDADNIGNFSSKEYSSTLRSAFAASSSFFSALDSLSGCCCCARDDDQIPRLFLLGNTTVVVVEPDGENASTPLVGTIAHTATTNKAQIHGEILVEVVRCRRRVMVESRDTSILLHDRTQNKG